MRNKLYFCFILAFILFCSESLISKDKIERIILDGSEHLADFGIDSTRNWWAVTEPFSGQYRYWINGKDSKSYIKISKIKFSPSGEKWAYFGRMNSGWNLVTNDTTIPINAYEIGDIKFSRIGEKIIYSYTESNQEYIYINNSKILMSGRIGEFYINRIGNKYAYMSKRGSSYILNINGCETQLFDNIKPMGYMDDDKFIYAAQNGNQWEVFKDNEALTESFKTISEAMLNPAGNTAGVIAQLSNDYVISVLINNDYTEPLYSNQYDQLQNLTVHPSDALIACNGVLNNNYVVLLNSTEYVSDEYCQAPKFSYDGSELYFLSCKLSCFISVNGKKYKMPGAVSPNINFVKKPNSMNIAYAGANSILMQEIDSGQIYASLIIDRIDDPIYNWKTDFYETLASIGDRLYLLGIRP